MGVRQFKPVTKSSRFRSVSDFADITRTEPEKSLRSPVSVVTSTKGLSCPRD